MDVVFVHGYKADSLRCSTLIFLCVLILQSYTLCIVGGHKHSDSCFSFQKDIYIFIYAFDLDAIKMRIYFVVFLYMCYVLCAMCAMCVCL